MSKIKIILYAIIIICSYDICGATFKENINFKEIKFSEDGKNETNFTIGNIKFSKEFMYTNFPRTNNTLNATFTFRNISRKDNVFLPYPNSIINTKGNCERLISVISFEIDDEDNLYILDEGKFNNSKICTPKLIIINNENNKTYILEKLPENIQLEDILIDKINKYIYISYHDYNNVNGIFVMHNDSYRINNTIKNLLYNDTTLKEEKGYEIYLNGKDLLPEGKRKIKSMGLSCDGQAFYYSFITSKKIYSILTKEIYNEYAKDDINDIKNVKIYEAYKNDSTSAIIYSNMGNLFLTGLEKNKIYRYDLIDNDLSRFDYKGLRELDYVGDIIFPEKMTFFDGAIYLLTNQFNSKNYKNYTIYKDDDIQEKSYMYGCAGLKYQFNLSFYVMLGIFLIILLFVLTFVIAGNIQDKDINKKNN